MLCAHAGTTHFSNLNTVSKIYIDCVFSGFIIAPTENMKNWSYKQMVQAGSLLFKNNKILELEVT